MKLWLLFPFISHLRLFLVYAWWILLQSWGTMRFSDHRGLKPSDVQVTGNQRPQETSRTWPSAWSTVMAQHRLGSPEKSRTLSKRLSFASSFFQLQRLSSERTQVPSLRFADQNSLTRSAASFWTPHSARTFLPSTTAALGVPKEQRDYLGGWSAQGSDNYSRVAARMFSNLQKLVIIARQSSSGDPFAEADTASQLDDHLCPKGYSVEDRAKCFKGLESTTPLRPQ